MQNHKSNLLQDRGKILLEGILNEEAIDFYSDVFDYHYNAVARWKETDPFKETLEFPLDASLLNPEGTLTDFLVRDLSELTGIIHKHNPGVDLGATSVALSSDASSIRGIIDLVLSKNTDELQVMADSAKVGFDEYVFLIINWLKPFFIYLKEKYSTEKQEDHGDRTCPFCGYFPDMALFSAEEDGRRYLRCGLCENIWPYKRISCAICGEENPRQLEYFTIEDEERYRIDACHSCGGYIKSVRLDKSEELDSCDLTVENLLTLALDTEMMNDGFGKP